MGCCVYSVYVFAKSLGNTPKRAGKGPIIAELVPVELVPDIVPDHRLHPITDFTGYQVSWHEPSLLAAIKALGRNQVSWWTSQVSWESINNLFTDKISH